ncbi:hypothetical protein Q3G72_010063 [Acer saccharum]|nr:hypothetical protein Q3G72_010063 [Acer saccharum]
MCRVAKSFKDLIMMLIAILSFVSSEEYLFKTKAAEMWVLVVSIIIYCLAWLSNVVVAIISGSLATVSLVSIFLPDSIGFLVFILWSLVPLVVAYQRIRSIFNNIHDACLTLRLDRQMIMDFIISKFSVHEYVAHSLAKLSFFSEDQFLLETFPPSVEKVILADLPG